nr:flagellar hook-length control protein FliK [Eubacterium sp.]
MQTQGISLSMSAVQSRTTGSTSKVQDSNFDRFMTRSTSDVSQRKEPVVNDKASMERSTNAGSEVNSSSEDFNKHKISLNDGTSKPNNLEHVDVENVESQVVVLLQQTFGLSEEEIVDILEQLGLTPMDLALMMSTDSVQITPINMESIKSVVMEVHGIDDANAFLLSDTMCQELNDIMSGIQDILSKELGVNVDQMSQDDTILMQSFAEKWEALISSQHGEVEETTVAEEPTMISDSMEMVKDTPVVVEMSNESGAENGNAGASKMATDSVHQEPTVQNESPIQSFAERLSDSFEAVSNEEMAASRVTMNSIVEQVVRHVRIRVLPQTTSMELQLNPESLGRVNLTVTSQNGTATATLTVQNEVAKEALESQIAVLKENLEEHGLKVESVEVTVSEFGFKNPEDSNQGAFQRKKSGGRRFRLDSAENVEETVETEEARQDGESVVDYTA